MKKTIQFLFLSLLISKTIAQSHTIHNNSTTVLITPGGISSSHISGTPTTNTNLSLGKDALPLAPLSATQNLFNTAIGHNALLTNASGSNNVALGFGVLRSLKDGNRNIGIGNNALQLNNSGTANIGIGFNALRDNVFTSQNTSIGDSSLSWITQGGGNNVAIGKGSMKLMTNATNNIAIGTNALSSKVNWFGRSDHNIAIGFEAMKDHNHSNSLSSINNLSIGHKTLSKSIQNGGSTIIGSEAYANVNFSTDNVVLGALILQNATTGNSGNTLIGSGVMRSSNGSNNIVIGNNAAQAYPTFNNTLVIDNSSTTSPLIGGDFTLNKIGINRLYSAISADANTLQVAGRLGISEQLNFGLDTNSGFSFIKNSGTGAAGNLELSTNAIIRMEVNSAGILKLTNVPTYADDAAAGTGGLTTGQVYKTTTGQLMIKL